MLERWIVPKIPAFDMALTIRVIALVCKRLTLTPSGLYVNTMRDQGAVALTVGSVPPKLRHLHWLLKINNQLNGRHLETILRGTGPLVQRPLGAGFMKPFALL